MDKKGGKTGRKNTREKLRTDKLGHENKRRGRRKKDKGDKRRTDAR